MIRRFISFTSRFCLFLIVATVAGCWFYYGYSLCHAPSTEEKSKQVIDELISLVRQRDPNAASQLGVLPAQYDNNALAATLLERFRRTGTYGLTDLAAGGNDSALSNLKLTSFALQSQLVSPDERQQFLAAHLTPLEQCRAIKDQVKDSSFSQIIDDWEARYLQTLQDASSDPALWATVCDNPMMVLLREMVSAPDLLAYYQAEKEWLDELIFVVLTNYREDSTDQPTDFAMVTTELLALAKRNNTLLKDAVLRLRNEENTELGGEQSDELTANNFLILFSLFSCYEEVIHLCADRENIPAEELLDILFANLDFLETIADRSPAEQAQLLSSIAHRFPDLWQCASSHILLLQLSQDAPDAANELARRFGEQDIALFLYANYPDDVPTAANAIEQYGELAIYILNRYQNSTVFCEALTDQSLGVRVIPFTAKFGDGGLERLETNSAWLDKYFDATGNPIIKEWWTTLPVGSAFDVARSWATGKPSEWSELGWATVDVADVALLVLTLGTSAPATATRVSTTAGAKTATRELAKQATKTATRTGGREIATTATRTGTKSLALHSAGKGTTKRSVLRHSLGTTAGRAMKLVPVNVSGKIRFRTAVLGGSAAAGKGAILKMFQATRFVRQQWKMVPLVAKNRIYRSLLYTGIIVTLACRTVPAIIEQLPQIANDFGAFVAKGLRNGGQALATAIGGCLQELMGNGSAGWIPVVCYSIIGFLMLGAVWSSLRVLRSKRSSATPVHLYASLTPLLFLAAVAGLWVNREGLSLNNLGEANLSIPAVSFRKISLPVAERNLPNLSPSSEMPMVQVVQFDWASRLNQLEEAIDQSTDRKQLLEVREQLQQVQRDCPSLLAVDARMLTDQVDERLAQTDLEQLQRYYDSNDSQFKELAEQFLKDYPQSSQQSRVEHLLDRYQNAQMMKNRLEISQMRVFDRDSLSQKAEAVLSFLDQFGTRAGDEAESIRRAALLAKQFLTPQEYTLTLKKYGGFSYNANQRLSISVGGRVAVLDDQSHTKSKETNVSRPYRFVWEYGRRIVIDLQAQSRVLTAEFETAARMELSGPLALRQLSNHLTLRPETDGYRDWSLSKRQSPGGYFVECHFDSIPEESWNDFESYIAPGNQWNRISSRD